MDITGVFLTCVVSTCILIFFEREDFGRNITSPIVKKHIYGAGPEAR